MEGVWNAWPRGRIPGQASDREFCRSAALVYAHVVRPGSNRRPGTEMEEALESHQLRFSRVTRLPQRGPGRSRGKWSGQGLQSFAAVPRKHDAGAGAAASRAGSRRYGRAAGSVVSGQEGRPQRGLRNRRQARSRYRLSTICGRAQGRAVAASARRDLLGQFLGAALAAQRLPAARRSP